MTNSDAVFLRDVKNSDLPVLFDYQRDPESTQMANVPPRDWDAFMAHWTTRILGDPRVVAKVIVAGGSVAGFVVSFERFGKREVGYWVGRTHWGRGIATKALAALLHLDPARPLYARVSPHNVGSLRVLEKCGFAVTDEPGALEGAPDDWADDIILKLGA